MKTLEYDYDITWCDYENKMILTIKYSYCALLQPFYPTWACPDRLECKIHVLTIKGYVLTIKWLWNDYRSTHNDYEMTIEVHTMTMKWL